MHTVDGGRPDEGSIVLVVVVVMALCLTTAVGVGRLGEAVAARAQAQAAADAAALAGVTAGRAAAEHVARANGAVLVSFVRSGWTVTVLTRSDGVSARARASNGP